MAQAVGALKVDLTLERADFVARLDKDRTLGCPGVVDRGDGRRVDAVDRAAALETCSRTPR